MGILVPNVVVAVAIDSKTMSQLELEKIVGTAVSAVVTAMVIGAAAIVWKGATTVDAKVNQATEDLSVQAAYITEAVVMLEN